MLPGATSSAPSVGRARARRIGSSSSARGIDNAIKEREYDPRVQRWTDWQDRPAADFAAGAGGRLLPASGSFELFAPGTDGKLLPALLGSGPGRG